MGETKSFDDICKEIDLFLDELTKPSNLDDVKVAVKNFCEANLSRPIVLVTVSLLKIMILKIDLKLM